MRPKTIPEAGLFTASEIERACGFARRQLEFLRREDLLPEPIEKGSRGRAELFDFTGLSVLAATGVLAQATGLLAFSARIARSIVGELAVIYYRIPINIDSELKKLPSSVRAGFSLDAAGEFDQFEAYRALRKHSEGFEAGQARAGDFIILIANGRYVFSQTHGGVPIFDTHPRILAGFSEDVRRALSFVQPELEIIRDGDEASDQGTQVILFHNLCVDDDAASRERFRFDQALANASSTIRVNLSLSVRNALEAISIGRNSVRGAS